MGELDGLKLKKRKELMDKSINQVWEEEATLWTEIAALTPGTVTNRLALGQRFRELRRIFSDRNSGGHRLTFGHGVFEEEIRRRGYRPRTVRGWIQDFESAVAGKPLSSEKRRARLMRSKASSIPDPLAEFAALLPLAAAQTAFRMAARILHPDVGGDERRMQQLNDAWSRAKAYYQKQDWPSSAAAVEVHSEMQAGSSVGHI